MKHLILTFALASLVCGPVYGQEAQSSSSIDITAFAPDQEGGFDSAPMIIMSESNSDGGSTTSSMRVMSGIAGGGGNMVWSGGGGMPFVGGDDFSMLQNPSVQKDLELVDDQLDQVLDMQRRHGEQIREALGDVKEGITPEGVERLRAAMEELKKKQKDELSGLLLPHQQDRLKQVALQMQMQSQGTAQSLVNGRVAEELGIDDEQKERLQARSEELTQQLQQQIEDLRAQAKEDLLNELTSEQREKLESLIGDNFKNDMNDWTEQFQQREERRRRD